MVKAKFRARWSPAKAFRDADPDGKRFGTKDRYTRLRVQLNPDGSLWSVLVENPSGVDLLDQRAVQAFEEAAPFPPPPAELVDDGHVNFRFGFYFDLGNPGRAGSRVPGGIGVDTR